MSRAEVKLTLGLAAITIALPAIAIVAIPGEPPPAALVLTSIGLLFVIALGEVISRGR